MLLACLFTTLTGAESRPNIIFILIDDFGYADSEPYGAKDIRTPHMSRLAKEGLKFTNFYANAPVCSPTRCGFITGRWQQRFGMEWAMGYAGSNFRRENDQWVRVEDIHGVGLPNTVQTFPKLLQKAGYVTGVFGKWHLGYKDEFNPLHHGFNEYFGELLGHADYYTYSYYDGTYALRDGLKPIKAEGYITDLINKKSCEFIERNAKRPFFLYIPHLAVHAPYQPPNRPLPHVTKENINEGNRADYVAMVERIDDGVGMILKRLEDLGIADNTLVVLSSDNGGTKYSDNSPLFHSKTTLWEGGIRVPCLMRWPGKVAAGTITDQVAITMDLSATFTALAQTQAAADTPFDGINLMPLLQNTQAPLQDRALFWRCDNPTTGRRQKAVRSGKWKYIKDCGIEMLFDLSVDIGEKNNLFFKQQDVITDMREKLAAWENEIAKENPQYLVK